MPRNGYWVECVPLAGDQANQNLTADLYSASVSSIPELTETAPSPDQAIEKLRARLRAIRRQNGVSGQIMPELDNPVRPPKRLRSISGWISVYINVGDQTMGEFSGVRSAFLHSLAALTSVLPLIAV